MSTTTGDRISAFLIEGNDIKWILNVVKADRAVISYMTRIVNSSLVRFPRKGRYL